MMQVFTPLIGAFDSVVLATIHRGSAAMITLITPLLMTCFSIYLLLLCLSYWNSGSSIPVGDTIKRVMAWAAIISFGLNIEMYSTYVVPFFQGFGDDIAAALMGGDSTGIAMVLDTLLNGYVRGIVQVWEGLPANPLVAVVAAIEALLLTIVILVGGTIFLGISAAYIILAHFGLSLLLALGPLFISCALFPATRKFFDSWVAQSLNYGILTVLFAAASTIQVKFAVDAMPGSGSELARAMYGDSGAAASGGFGLLSVIALAVIFAVFTVVATNLPALASQLAGGMGISGLVGSGGIGKAAGGAAKWAANKAKKGGGSMAPESAGAGKGTS